jgi:hypothetical protein
VKVTVPGDDVAVANELSPALVAVAIHVPAPVAVTPPIELTAQPVAVPPVITYVIAPVPLPPEVVITTVDPTVPEADERTSVA